MAYGSAQGFLGQKYIFSGNWENSIFFSYSGYLWQCKPGALNQGEAFFKLLSHFSGLSKKKIEPIKKMLAICQKMTILPILGRRRDFFVIGFDISLFSRNLGISS
jgi:hypothetical protein